MENDRMTLEQRDADGEGVDQTWPPDPDEDEASAYPVENQPADLWPLEFDDALRPEMVEDVVGESVESDDCFDCDGDLPTLHQLEEAGYDLESLF